MSPRRAVQRAGAGALVAAAAVGLAPAAAANPFGVGMAEPAMAPGGDGPFGRLLSFIAARQAEFYGALTEALQGISGDPAAGWWLVALSFAYGVFHAAGPGHGKAVISAYVLADRQSAARATLLSFGAALVQATSAVVLVLVAVSVIGMTSIAIGATARWVEIASYGALVLVGTVLVWRKVVRPAVARIARAAVATAPEPRTVSAAAVAAADGDHHHDHDADGGCCGHAHAIAPADAARAGDWRGALAVMVSVGLRPCSGAIIVLVFALAMDLLPYGLLSVYAMGVGVGLTVAVIAALAVLARGASERFAGDAPVVGRVFRLVEAGAALAVLALGLLLLLAALAG